MLKFKIEIPIHASPKMLFNKLATPSGLEEWFADKVNLNGKVMSFSWEEFEEKAKIISKKEEKLIKFKWLESEEDESFFQFEIIVDDITHDVSIIITDFADDEDAVEESKQLWKSQIEELRVVIGG